jgi:hypothetical protein
MDDLLAEVLDAHGGLEEWGKVSTLTAKLSLGGPFWGLRGWPKVYAGQTVTLDAHREHITFAPFTAPDRVWARSIEPLDQVGGATLPVGVADLLLALAGLELADLDVL